MALRGAASRSIQVLALEDSVAVKPTVINALSRQLRYSNLQTLRHPILCRQDLTHKHQQQRAFFSAEASSSSSSSFSPVEWWRKRQETQEVEKYKSRIAAMAEKESWVVGDMVAELDEVVNSWKAKIPGVSGIRETQMAKQMYKTLTGIVKVVGHDATDETLDRMTRGDKLKAALEGETTVEEINTAIGQFRVMALMQRVVRKRKLEGKTIPSTAEGVQAIIQSEGSKMLSKAQKSKMGKDQARNIMRRRR